jgi:hypothetical protein
MNAVVEEPTRPIEFKIEDWLPEGRDATDFQLVRGPIFETGREWRDGLGRSGVGIEFQVRDAKSNDDHATWSWGALAGEATEALKLIEKTFPKSKDYKPPHLAL